MTSRTLEWIVALLVCWASLTAIYQSSASTPGCDVRYSASTAPQRPLPRPTQAEIEDMIRDMKLHD
jgi:hypothetical protein